MKNYTLLYLAIASVFSFSCLAQRGDSFLSTAKMDNAQLMPDNKDDLAIVAYHVEERINMKFGSRITTYEVSNASLISTNELGANNTRVITPKYGKVKQTVQTVVTLTAVPMVQKEIPKIEISIPKNRVKSVNIDILRTYERVLEKGYRTEEMVRRVANARFFDGDLDVASKWYTQLYEMNPNWEPVYYYRYAESLKATGQNEKAREMMKLFEEKSK
jgi:tetratricopeptide (TPR) repeat protein